MSELLKAIESLGKLLGLDPATVGVLLPFSLGLLYWRFRYYKDALLGARSLPRICESLEARDWRSGYFRTLRNTLSRLDSKLGPSAWSADSYETTLTLAFFYPFASLFVVWLATGQNTSGIAELLPEDIAAWRRTLSLLSIGIYAHAYYYFLTHRGWRGSAYSVVAFAGAFVFAVTGVFAAGVAVAVVGAAAAALAFTVAFAAGGVFAAAAGGVAALVFASVFTAGGVFAAAAGGVAALVFASVFTAAVVQVIYNAMRRHGLKGLFFFVLSSLTGC